MVLVHRLHFKHFTIVIVMYSVTYVSNVLCSIFAQIIDGNSQQSLKLLITNIQIFSMFNNTKQVLHTVVITIISLLLSPVIVIFDILWRPELHLEMFIRGIMTCTLSCSYYNVLLFCLIVIYQLIQSHKSSIGFDFLCVHMLIKHACKFRNY